MGDADLRWVLLSKQIVVSDTNIRHCAFVNERTMVASVDRGTLLYFAGIFDIHSSRSVTDTVTHCFEDALESEESERRSVDERAVRDSVRCVLSYVLWLTSHYEMEADLEDFVSCLATNAEVNDGAGFVLIGGFD